MAGMVNDIVSEHRERMLNLKKYYPFFKLMEVSFAQFAGGKYEALDMGYLVMAILRYFIEENNFKEKDVTYPEYLDFLEIVCKRDFGLELTPQEIKEVGDYIFDKIKNEGRPFTFTYFDPVVRKRRTSRIKVIESEIRDNVVWYSISPDAIEFYLDTKEIRDESRISVQQLLLEKMIRAQDFRGGSEVVERINEEVRRLQRQKKEVLELLSRDVRSGLDAYDRFMDTGIRWFDEEERLFRKNRDLIAAAREKMEGTKTAGRTESYFRMAREIQELEDQLRIAMSRHGELLRECTDIQRKADEAVRRAKLGRLRTHVDFQDLWKQMVQQQDASILDTLLRPLFQPHPQKRIDLTILDTALESRPSAQEEAEKVSRQKPEQIVFPDEIEEERLRYNYCFLMENLLTALERRQQFRLEEFNHWMAESYTPEILQNVDYYSFFVNLCAKPVYRIGGGAGKEESFLDAILQEHFQDREPAVHFRITGTEPASCLEVGQAQMMDVTFSRENKDGK